MQKWFNDGYFSSDLPMRRVLYDTHWTTVEELKQRANGENIFLSPLLAPIPTSNRGNGSPMQSYPTLDNVFNEPYQPSPIRTLRTSTLESYLGGGSLPSDSPSSSVGASHFGNPSPDPGAFGGRDVKPYFGNEHLVSRLPNFGPQDHIAPFPDRRSIGHEYPNAGINIQQPAFGNFASDRDPSFNGYMYNPAQVSHDQWMMGSNNIPASIYAGGREPAGRFSYTASSEAFIPDIDQGRAEHVHHDPAARAFNPGAIYTDENLGAFNGHIPGSNEVHHGYGQYVVAGQLAFQNDEELLAPLVRDLQDINPQSNTLTGFRSLNIDSTPSKSPQTSNASFSPAPIQSPWKTLSSLSSSVPNVASPVPISSWNPEPSPIATPEHKDPVVAAPLPSIAEGSRNGAVPKDDLEVSPKPQIPGKPQKKVASPAPKKAYPRDTSDSAPISEASAPQSTQSAAKAIPIATLVPQESATAPAVSKTAWAKEEEATKKKATTPSISLREIQEAEAKKVEVRKAAEREKEKMARVSTVVESKEDIQPFTASWGLPTSQTGSRGSVPIREATTPAAQTPIVAPVWTTPVKQPTAKKSMKEIQEEEESRKKFAAKEVASAQAAAKRGYAESTTKVCANELWPRCRTYLLI